MASGLGSRHLKLESAVASFWRITIATLLVVFVLYKILDSVGPDGRIHDDEVSGHRLHDIDVAVCAYAVDHDGRLPDNLKGAAVGAWLDSHDTQCPPTRTHGAKLQNPPEFMYLGAGLPIKDIPDEQIIACEPFSASAANKNETIVILRADSHVESIPISEVEKRIRDAAIRLSKNHKTADSRP